VTKLGQLVFSVCAALGGLSVVVPVAGQDAAVRECVIVSRVAGAAPTVSDPIECGHATAPASTFKVPHALIALQTGVITPATVFKWNGTAYDFESWRRDHTLDSAMKTSVLPFFQNTARLIGAARMRKSLAEIRYAADTFDGDLTTFWIDGDLVVSPMEQFDFLQRLFSARLPIDPAHGAAVTSAMRMPAGQILLGLGARPFVLNWPKSTIVRAKTGNTTVNGERVSWLIGALELEGMHHTFVARVRSTGTLENTAGAELARRALNAR
jgi:beta-lactamase class D